MRSFESRVHSQYTQLFTVVKPRRVRLKSGRKCLPAASRAARVGSGRAGSLLPPRAEGVLTRLGRSGRPWLTVGRSDCRLGFGRHLRLTDQGLGLVRHPDKRPWLSCTPSLLVFT